ncbi:MAG: hypothetical protein IJB85_06910, partial [Clostridia bacterium]|nr:hypothetical protein [Clostridia bacterium]
CVRIKSVAFGSCLILAYLALRAWKRWAAAQTRLGTLSPDSLLRFAVALSCLNELSIPYAL